MIKRVIFLSSAVFALLFFILSKSSVVAAATYYISPTGNDNNLGINTNPWKTFAKAFSAMQAGDELILMDGTYTGTTTGYMHFDNPSLGGCSPNCAQIPSGTSLNNMTYVHAKNHGNVKVLGKLFIGRSFRRDQFIKIQGITFDGGHVYHANDIIIKDSGFSAGFGVGTNDVTFPATSNILIEDVWIWAAQQRIIASNYRSDKNVWRRVVVRGDGCNTASCAGSGNPNVGITVYDSTNTSLQNVIVVDRILAGGSPYGDFATAQHTPGNPFGNNEWLGTISLNAPDLGYYFEADSSTILPTRRLRNCVAWNAADGGYNIQKLGNTDIQNCTLKTLNGDGLRVRNDDYVADTIRNIVVLGSGRYGVNAIAEPSYINVNGAWQSTYYTQYDAGKACIMGCKTSDPLTDGSIKYITRVENGSPLKGAGFGGADYGANVVNRYGADGTFWNNPNYNTLGSALLWPWPNEDRVKQEMCQDTKRGFCADGNGLYGGPKTLTSYIWEYLGNPCPVDICNYGTQTFHPADTNQDGRIEMKELIAFIGKWKTSQATLTDVLDVMGRWMRGE